MKKITDEHVKKISKLLLESADYWINHIDGLSIGTQSWSDFKMIMEPFLHHPCILKTSPDSLLPNCTIGLVKYYQSGRYIIIGPRIDSSLYVYSLKIELHDNALWDQYAIKTKQIHDLIEQKQREEIESKFLQVIISHSDADDKVKSLKTLLPDFPQKDWIVKLYKDSWEAILQSDLENFTPEMYGGVINSGGSPTLPCVGTDQYIHFFEEPNSPGNYTLRFGLFNHGNVSMDIRLGENTQLQQYTKEHIELFSKHIEENVINKILANIQ